MRTYFFLLIFFFSCSNISKTSNTNILSEKKFIQIIKDVHLIEAKYETIKFKKEKVAKAILQNDYDSVFNLYDITYDNFQQTLKHYSLEHEKLELIYSQALEEIKKENSKLN
jgi:hypothetical protein